MTLQKPIRVGITGESGFIGNRLRNAVENSMDFIRHPFDDSFFRDEDVLYRFVSSCDVVIHLAGMTRPADDPIVYQTNIRLTEQLIRALDRIDSPPGVIFASSIREGENTAYGLSKEICRQRLESWAFQNGKKLISLQIPNVFGPGAKPFDNSFIATFCVQLIRGENPVVTENREIPLLHIDSICRVLAEQIVLLIQYPYPIVSCEAVEPDFRMYVSTVLEILAGFAQEIRENGFVAEIPDFGNGRCSESSSMALLREAFLSYLSI